MYHKIDSSKLNDVIKEIDVIQAVESGRREQFTKIAIMNDFKMVRRTYILLGSEKDLNDYINDNVKEATQLFPIDTYDLNKWLEMNKEKSITN